MVFQEIYDEVPEGEQPGCSEVVCEAPGGVEVYEPWEDGPVGMQDTYEIPDNTPPQDTYEIPDPQQDQDTYEIPEPEEGKLGVAMWIHRGHYMAVQDTKFLFQCCHEKRNFVSPSGHVMLCLLHECQYNTKPFAMSLFVM